MLKINRLYIRFQLGNSYGNICGKESPLIYACSIRQFIWEYLSGSGKGKSTYIFVFNWAILSGIYKRKQMAYIRFQLGNTFGNI